MIETLNNRCTRHFLPICTWSPMTVPQRGTSGNGYLQPSGFSQCGRYSGQAGSRTREKMGFAFRLGRKIFALIQSIQSSSRASPVSLSMCSWSFHRGTQKYAASLNQGCTSPGRLNFVLWRLIFASPQYGTCFFFDIHGTVHR